MASKYENSMIVSLLYLKHHAIGAEKVNLWKEISQTRFRLAGFGQLHCMEFLSNKIILTRKKMHRNTYTLISNLDWSWEFFCYLVFGISLQLTELHLADSAPCSPVQVVWCCEWHLLPVPRAHWEHCQPEAALWLEQDCEWGDYPHRGLQDPEGQGSGPSQPGCERPQWEVCVHPVWHPVEVHLCCCCKFTDCNSAITSFLNLTLLTGLSLELQCHV